MSNAQLEIDAILAEAQNALATLTEETEGISSAGPLSTSSEPTPPPPPVRAPGTANINLRRVLQIEVPVIVRLAERKMPVKSIMQLATGSIIEFEKPADDELDLLINNKCVGHGRAVKVGENFGLRITAITDAHGKIAALTGG